MAHIGISRDDLKYMGSQGTFRELPASEGSPAWAISILQGRSKSLVLGSVRGDFLGSLQIGGSLLGAPITRIMVCWGLYWGP